MATVSHPQIWGEAGRNTQNASLNATPKAAPPAFTTSPESQSECLLEPGLQGKAFIAPSIGLFLLLLGGVFLAAHISVMRDNSKDG